jgi:hypothetical protein
MGADNGQSTIVDLGAAEWLAQMKKLTDQLQLPGVDVQAIVDWQRKDIEALMEANRQAYEGIKALVDRRNAMLQETMAQWQTAFKDASGVDGVSKQVEAAKRGVESAVANFQELSQLEAQARINAWNVVQNRMQENLSSLQKLLLPK